MKARAFIVGVNAYPELSQQRTLSGAVADAADFADWALDPNGGGVQPEHLYFWTYPPPDNPSGALAAATDGARAWPEANRPDFAVPPNAAHIKRGVFAAAREAAAGDEEERLYVFLAGHGVQVKKISYDQDPQNCFVAADYVPGSADGLIPLDDLRRACESQGPHQVIFFFDCCRNHLMPTAARPTLGLNEYVDNGINSQWMIGSAAKNGAFAYETPAHAPERGAFSKMFIQGLRQFRCDNRLTLEELKNFVRSGVADLVHPKSQIPQFGVKDDQTSFVIIDGPPIGDPPNLNIQFTVPPDTEVQIADAEARPVQTVICQGHDEIVCLPVGQYFLESRALEKSVTVKHFGPEDTHVTF